MDQDELIGRIRSLARSLGIVNIGIADTKAWKTDELVSRVIRECSSPLSLMPGSRSVISIGIPVQRAILATAPSSYYSEHYKILNSMLDHASQRIAAELQISGYEAMFVSRDGYTGIDGLRKDPSSFFSHRHSAYLAGLGTFGASGMLITEGYGPRMRFTSVITDAELPHGGPLKKQLCIGCGRCADECPEGAVASSAYPDELTEKQKCVEYSALLKKRGCSPCGRCIFVCPVGNDTNGPLPSEEAVANIRRYTE